jgi:hypothetical protein
MHHRIIINNKSTERDRDYEQRAGGTVLMDLAYPTQSIDGRFLPFLFLFI